MQTTYIARQAIFDRKSVVIGYELLFRNSVDNQFPKLDLNIATSKLIIQNHIHGDISALCMGKLAFINFTEHCLVNKFPLLFNKNEIVIELVSSSKPTGRFVKILQYYCENGYKIALSDYNLEPHWDVVLPYLYSIKVDVEKINVKRLTPLLTKFKKYELKLIAQKVETRYQLQSLSSAGFHYYQGFFYHEPEIVEGSSLAPMKVQMLHLISETFNVPFNFDAVSRVISQDVNLTISILKLVNNVSTNNKVEITSLKQAAAYLGESKLKQFVTILALSKLTSEETEELAKQALITGKLMSVLAQSSQFSEVEEQAFITGILSVIEALLNMPLEQIMETMPLSPIIVNALVNYSGKLGTLLTFTTDYISGKQENTKEKLADYKIDEAFIQREFVAASQWCMELET